MKWGNRIVFIFLLLISGGGFYFSVRYGIGSIAHPGPGFFPLLSSLLMGLFSLALLIVFHSEGERLWFELKWQRVIYVSGVMLFYGLSVEKLGFLLSNFIALVLLSYTIERPRWYVAILLSSAIASAFDIIFRALLGLPLPIGLLRIL